LGVCLFSEERRRPMAWRYGRKVLAVVDWDWGGCWAMVDGGFGWMRPGRDLDIMATLFTHAKEGNRFVDIDEDPVGVINRIYVW
jgi:hypothetical protein